MAPKARDNLADIELHGYRQQDESQDSQFVTMLMHRLHGAGDRSIRDRGSKAMTRGRYPKPTGKSPATAATAAAKHELAPATGPAANLNRPPPTARAPNASINRAVASSQPTSGQSTRARITTIDVVCHRLPKACSQTAADGSVLDSLITKRHDDNGSDEANNSPSASRPHSRTHRRAKMDLSQSPTQSNDGRSYDQYLPRGDDLIPSDGFEPEHLLESQQSATTSVNEGTTLDNDTGIVNFEFSTIGRQDTQVSYPDVYDSDGLQQTSPIAVVGVPETPATPRNPFADSKASLMAASQMFRHTQPSSAHKIFSPTSSRPSPDNIHTLHSLSPLPATSSPLKMATAIPSALLAQSPDVFETSPRQAAAEILSDNESRENKPLREAHESEATSDTDAVRKARGRHRQVLNKGKASQRRLRNTELPQPSASDEIVPSTNREMMLGSATRQFCDYSEEDQDRDSQVAIEDTQVSASDPQPEAIRSANEVGSKLDSVGGNSHDVSSNEAVVPNTASSPTESAELPVPVQREPSPAPDGPKILGSIAAKFRPRAIGEMLPNSSDEESRAESFTNLLGSSLANHANPRPRGNQSTHEEVPGQDSGVGITPLRSQAAIAETSPPINSSPPPPAHSTRARLRSAQSRSSLNAPTLSSHPTSSTSSLSRLGATPELSDETTPATEELPRRRLTSSSMEDSENSPAVAKANRRRDQKVDVKPKTSHSRTSNRDPNLRSKRSLELGESTDELARSSSISSPAVHQQSARLSRYSKASLKETPISRESSRETLFAGMAFAISFQAKQVGERDSHYNSRIAASSEIANKIKQGGGKVLTNGFDQLFEVTPVKNAECESISAASTPQPDDEIKLAPSAQATGFTALIADGHTRKVKYMQALALGLPCVHERWVTMCVEKQKLVDWSDYLLCAGHSSCLNDAIKSRNLSPYDAATAKLSETIQHRPRLLNQSRILLIMSKAEEQKKMAYVFLARVLGASLYRVYTMDEARKQLKRREDADHPFDWVYLEEKIVDSSSLFSSTLSVSTATSTTTRKRKRRNETSLCAPPPKKIRTLSDELVIQSLILGRLIDEDEMTI